MNSGSRWHRWDPHIHVPGTILNDQFTGPDQLERYLTKLETAEPTIRALGITDYYSCESYERICAAKDLGRLEQCELLFLNIEMRLGIGTQKGKYVNVHLLVSPEDPEHLKEIRRFLGRLTFHAHDEVFSCNPDDLIKLGKLTDTTVTDDNKALEIGSIQFKVDFQQLKDSFRQIAWARQNILVAVAANQTDGTSGVRDSSDTTLRREIEKFAHVIFSADPAQRKFWIGQGVLTPENILTTYGGLKPCLHGCDAHDFDRVAAPSDDRFSWIKGAVHFDALRQAAIDPAGRAFIGQNPPLGPLPSQRIDAINIIDADWAKTPELQINPGLVAVIGARGSGKTALVDIIAEGCDAHIDRENQASFLGRANDLLGNAKVQITFGSGATEERRLDGLNFDDPFGYSRVKYLSQKFVEELCSANGIADDLIKEIERVIFQSHNDAERDGCLNFQELLDLRAQRFRSSRVRDEAALAALSDRIAAELDKEKLVGGTRTKIAEAAKLIEDLTKDRLKLVVAGSEVRVARLGDLNSAAIKVRGYLRFYAAQEQSLLTLRDEVKSVRDFQAPNALRQIQERFDQARLKEGDWSPFLMDYTGDVNATIEAYLKEAQRVSVAWRGVAPPQNEDVTIAHIQDDEDISKLPLARLEVEIGRLERLVSIDKDTASRFSAVSRRIAEETSAKEKLEDLLKDYEKARERATSLVAEREEAYARVFQAIAEEQNVLIGLHAPVMAKIAASDGTLGKLSFNVKRIADVDAWASAGEKLFDLRKQSPFKGRGALGRVTVEALQTAWETGGADKAREAMATFRNDYQQQLLEFSPVTKDDAENFRAWSKRFAHWLYNTDHISIQYSMEYDGTDISKLSPGTRGIVLLLLYLALDDQDDRPLLIDQPEENLDPKSIFDELVTLFIDAKQRRQVIMVTHNANLVINTDADQIIVATSGPREAQKLPGITYNSGGLEDADIRLMVCNILEGGEAAFKERARRLRVRLER